MTATLLDLGDINHSSVILDLNGTNQLTVHTASIKEQYKKILVVLPIPNANGNNSVYTNKTKIVDLQRITREFVVDGYIDSAYKQAFRNIVNMSSVDNDSMKFTLIAQIGSLDIDEIGLGTGVVLGVISEAELGRPATEIQDEWPVHFTLVTGIRV